jgi:REP element-mobilizing transposase RayT
MSHTFTRQLLHIVFSTKMRQPLLTPDLQPRMFGYIRTISNDLNVKVLALNGMADHVHLAVDLPAALSTAEYLTKMKANSSRWFRREFSNFDFSWQRGYGSFSVSPSKLAEVQAYIDNQERHHASQSFEEELRNLVANHGLEFDERALLE